MDSRAVKSHAHEHDEYHHNVGSPQVAHGEEGHNHDHEKKSVLKKVKAKAKKIKDKVTGHGHDEYHYEDQHIPDDHDLDEEDDEDEEETVHDPEIHGATIYGSAAVRSGTPGQVQNIGRPGHNFGGTTAMVEPLHQEPRVVVISPTTGISQSRVTDPIRTFVGENMGVQHKVNLERPMGLEEDPHAPRSTPVAHDPANYQTKVTDPTGTGGAEIDITLVQSSLSHMAVHNEPKPNLEPKVLPTIAETQHPLAVSHHQFVAELSSATKTQYPSAQTHVHNQPQLSSEIKTQYPRSHDQLMPTLPISTKTHYPSTTIHDQNLPGLSSATQTHYPSARNHDQFMEDLHGSTKTHYPSAISHDQNMPNLESATKTHYPSAGSHDQFMPELHGLTKSHYSSTKSHDQTLPELSSATQTHYPSAGSHDQFVPSTYSSSKSHHDQDLPHISSATKPYYPSAGSHNQFLSGLSTEPKNQHSSAKSHHDQDLSNTSRATKTKYPSVGSHDQFVPDWSTQTKPHYPTSGNQAQIISEPIPITTNSYSQNPKPTTTTTRVEEQPQQPHYESMEKPSNESSYTDKISSATSAIADKAITAKNEVASKLGYGEKDNDRDQNETRYHEENTSFEKPSNQSSYTEKISSATSAIADKAVSAKNTVASKLGYGETGDNRDNKGPTTHEEEKRDTSTTSTAAEYGKNIAISLTEKLAPVYGKVAGVGSEVKPKLPGIERESVDVQQDKGFTVKEYLVDKLRPGDEDKALSEVIAESLYKKKEDPTEVRDVKNMISDALHKREGEEPERGVGHRPLGKVTESEEVKRRLGSDEKTERRYEESYVNSPGTGVVDKLKNVVGSWFGGNPEENQSSQVSGDDDLAKNSGAGVGHVGQGVGERRLQESSH